jgi:hypothetical protein
VALVRLDDRGAVPRLRGLLRKSYSCARRMEGGWRKKERELVRVNHLANEIQTTTGAARQELN